MISVVIPTFNRATYVLEAVESVIQQTHKALEIIVVDDGSTDNTLNILTPLAREKHLRVLRQANKGVSAARNWGIRQAAGEYIAFLDSDDKWLPWHLKQLLGVMEAHGQCDVAFSGFDFFGETGEAGKFTHEFSLSIRQTLQKGFQRVDDNVWLSTTSLLETMFRHGFPFRVQASLVKRDYILKHNLYFDESISYTEDAQFFIEAALNTRFAYIDNVSALVRRHPDNYGDLCYADKRIASYESRVKRLNWFFEGKISHTEQRALKHLVCNLEARVMQGRFRKDRTFKRLLKESLNLLLRAPSLQGLKSIVKMILPRGRHG